MGTHAQKGPAKNLAVQEAIANLGLQLVNGELVPISTQSST